MEHWTVCADDRPVPVDVAGAARIVAAIGSPDRTMLAAAVLATLRPRIGVHHCSMMVFEGERSPRLMSGASLQHQWHVFNIASIYARDHFRHDGLQALIGRYPASFEDPPVLVHRQRRRDIGDTAYGADCWDSIGIADRIAVLVRVGRTQSLAVNLYRDRSAGDFADDEVVYVRSIAPLIANCAARHYALDVDGEGSVRGAVTDELDELCPGLTAREREVVQRILDGATTERIAEELHIRPTTVITYRARAYDKLGVATRRELFAAVMRRRGSERRAA